MFEEMKVEDDGERKEREEEDEEENQRLEYPALSSLDIIAYGYLKEELINTSFSKEVILNKLMKHRFNSLEIISRI